MMKSREMWNLKGVKGKITKQDFFLHIDFGFLKILCFARFGLNAQEINSNCTQNAYILTLVNDYVKLRFVHSSLLWLGCLGIQYNNVLPTMSLMISEL